MQLTFQRSQAKSNFNLVPLRIAGGMMFRLRAKLDFSQEEQFLVDRYRLREAMLIEGEPFEVLRRAVRTSAIICVPIWGILGVILGWQIATVLLAFGFAGVVFWVYDQLREHIYVRDLMDGRSFQCFSIIALIEKEWYLRRICGYFRQVLESARNWDDRETIDIEALSPEAAKHVVLTGP